MGQSTDYSNKAVPIMELAFPKAKPVKVFISHKELDRAICTKISDNLKKEFGSDISIFLSSDAKCIPGGEDWQQTIERNLRSADWMFFVYLNPRLVWDWCLYEAGLFLGSGSRSDRRQRLVVLHPDGVLPPTPFAKIQAVGANVAAIEETLRLMLAKTRNGRAKTDADWNRIAEPISEAIQTAAIQFFDGRYLLTAKCPMTANPHDPLDVHVDEGHAEICFNPDAQHLFEIGVESGISWRRFGENLNDKKGQPTDEWEHAFDFVALRSAAIGIRRDKHLGVGELQSFRVGSGGYRPIITGADLKIDGTVHLTLYLVKIPNSLDSQSMNNFDTVYRSLSLGCQLRREFVERNWEKLSGLLPNDPEAKTLLPNIWRALQSVVAESDNWGLTPDRTRDAFAAMAPAEIDELIVKWHQAYDAFHDAVTGLEVEMCKDLFTVLRYLNLRFLKLAESRLNQILAEVQLPDTDHLMPAAKALLPVAKLTRARGTKRPTDKKSTATIVAIDTSTDTVEIGAEPVKQKRSASRNSYLAEQSTATSRSKTAKKPK